MMEAYGDMYGDYGGMGDMMPGLAGMMGGMGGGMGYGGYGYGDEEPSHTDLTDKVRDEDIWWGGATGHFVLLLGFYGGLF